jgi:hypothetical protein
MKGVNNMSVIWDIVFATIGYVIEENEREARERWEHKRKQVERSVKDKERQIKRQLQEAKEKYNFKRLTSNHQSSLNAADSAYKSLQDARTTLDCYGKMILKAKERRTVLENNFKKQIKDYAAREKIKEELKVIADFRKKLFLEKDKVKEQRDNLYLEVKSLNAKTTKLKYLIRDHCGEEGVDWCSRLEKRQRLNQSNENYPINDSSNAMVKYKPAFIVLGNNRIRLSNVKDYGIEKGYELVEQRKDPDKKPSGIVSGIVDRLFDSVWEEYDPRGYKDAQYEVWIKSLNEQARLKCTMPPAPKMEKVYYRYLFVTTYQNDNFKFVEEKCDFDIDEELKKLDRLMNLDGIESNKYSGAIMDIQSTNATPKQLFETGMAYYNGEGVDHNYDEAVKWVRLAADQGDANAQNALGESYYSGNGVAQNYIEAVKWARMAANKGYAAAQYAHGTLYYYGKGLTPNYNDAVKWFHKAADQGHSTALCGLGWCYELGHGVTKNKKEAMKWFRLAADQGDKEAQKKLDEYDQ